MTSDREDRESENHRLAVYSLGKDFCHHELLEECKKALVISFSASQFSVEAFCAEILCAHTHSSASIGAIGK